MGIRAGLLIVLLVAVTAAATWADRTLPGGCRQLVAGQVRFIAGVRPLSRRATYIMLEMRPTEGGSEPALSELRLGASRLRFASVAKDDLLKAGFRPATTPRNRVQTFAVDFGPKRTDAGINLTHVDNAIRSLSIICRSGDLCDFSVAWEGGHAISLPVSEATLRGALPTPGLIRGCEDWGF